VDRVAEDVPVGGLEIAAQEFDVPDLKRRMRRRKVVNAAARLVVIAAVIGLWQLVVSEGWIGTYIASSPKSTATQLWDLLVHGSLLRDVAATLYEASVGYALAVVAGVLAGFVLALFARIGEILEPFIVMFNSLPRIALAPLLLLWFGFGSSSKIALTFSIVFFVLVTNTVEGAHTVDRDIVTVSRVLGATPLQIVRKVVLPSTIPWIVAGMRLSIAYGLGGAVVGEMFAGNSGVGALISAANGAFNVDEIFAALIVIMLIAYLLDVLSRRMERRLLHWRPEVPLR
jgi:NitT/TauT family transport system permease protein